jgi:cytochrome bd-type quinol oxidase subunit 2
MTTTTNSTHQALRPAKRLIGWYLALSTATLVAVVLLRHDASVVDDAVWTRTVIVVASAMLTYLFAARAARGSRGAFRRLRIVTAVMTVAIAVITVLPGVFPVWLRVEQFVCGLLLLAVLIVVNGRDVRALFRNS